MATSRGIIKKRNRRIDLGLAIAGATLQPGKTRSQGELAAYAGISRAAIYLIEKTALRKIRKSLGYHHFKALSNDLKQSL